MNGRGTKRKARTVRVSGETVRQIRLGRGWSLEKLAEKARCSEKTIKNIENSTDIYISTLDKLAKALEVDPARLVDSKRIFPEELSEGRTIEVTIIRNDEFVDFDETKQLIDLINNLIKLAKFKGKVKVIEVLSGSVAIHLLTTEEDCLQLVEAFYNEKLMAIEISAISIGLGTNLLAVKKTGENGADTVSIIDMYKDFTVLSHFLKEARQVPIPDFRDSLEQIINNHGRKKFHFDIDYKNNTININII